MLFGSCKTIDLMGLNDAKKKIKMLFSPLIIRLV